MKVVQRAILHTTPEVTWGPLLPEFGLNAMTASDHGPKFCLHKLGTD